MLPDRQIIDMGSSEERNPRSASVKRTRSLSESIKGIFKGGNSSGHAQHPGSPNETPPAILKKNSSRLGNITINKEAELSSSRGAPIQAPTSPLQRPIAPRQSNLGVPKLSKLSLSQPSQPSSSDNDHASPPPNLSEEEEFARARNSSGRQSDEERRGRDVSREGRQRPKQPESRSYNAQQSAEQEDSGLIDSVL